MLSALYITVARGIAQVRVFDLFDARQERHIATWLNTEQADLFIYLIDNIRQRAAIAPILHVRQRVAQLLHALPGGHDSVDHRSQSAPLGPRRHGIDHVKQRAEELLIRFRLDGVKHDIDESLGVNPVNRADSATGDLGRFLLRYALARRYRIRFHQLNQGVRIDFCLDDRIFDDLVDVVAKVLGAQLGRPGDKIVHFRHDNAEQNEDKYDASSDLNNCSQAQSLSPAPSRRGDNATLQSV